MKNLTLFFVSFFVLILAKAQDDTYVKMPHSPDVESLGRYGEYPVDYYHGLPNINIPLYNIVAGSLSLPISLSYHASGIKVDQEASRVGLGWSLNAGGIISRTIKGASDFENSYESKTFDDIDNGDYPVMDDISNFFISPSHYDGEPDVYNYNFAGYSGQFILDKQDDYKIVPLGNNEGLKFGQLIMDDEDDITTYHFNITDKNGIVYEFSNVEINDPRTYLCMYIANSEVFAYYNTTGGEDKITAWFLTKIVDANNVNAIDFNYEDESIVHLGNTVGSLYYHYSINADEWVLNPESIYHTYQGGDDKVTEDQGLYSMSCDLITTPVLKSITTSTDLKVVFNNEYERKDLFLYPALNDYESKLSSSYALSSIDVYQNDERLKNIEFDYAYFNSSITTESVQNVETKKHIISARYFRNTNFASLNYRLKLKKVTISNKDATENLPPYLFSYYDEYLNKMPFKKTYSGIDVFGYCNGIPTAEEASYFKNLFPNIETSFYSVYSCIQKDGSYNTECGYEPTYSLLGTVFNYPITNTTVCSFSEGSDRKPNLEYCRVNSLKTITFPTGGVTTFEYELNDVVSCPNNLISNSSYAGGTYNYGEGLRIKKITNSYGEDKYTSKEFSYGQPIVEQLQQWITPYTYNIAVVNTNPLYTFQIHSSPVINSSKVCYGKVKEKSLAGTTVYEYYNPTDNPIDYESRYFGLYSYNSTCQYTFSAYTLSKPVYPFWNSVKGNSFYEGKLKNKSFLDSDNNILRSVSYTYDFIAGDDIYATQVIPSFAQVKREGGGGVAANTDDPRVNIYKIPTGQAFLNQKITSEYLNNDVINSLTETYVYDQDKNLLKEKSIVNSNNDVVKTTFKYPSDFELADPSDGSDSEEVMAIMEMKDRNILDVPIEVVNYIGSNVVSAKLNTYRINDNLVVPYRIYDLEIDEPLADFEAAHDEWSYFDYNENYFNDVEFTEYDSNGNILEVKNNITGITTSYIWGYNFQYLIAKVENAKFSEVESVLTSEKMGNTTTYFDALQNQKYYDVSSWDWITVTEENIISMLDLLRTNIKNAQVTTYTYDPLIGMTSQTDPNGKTTYYEYDDFNRLEYVRDQDKNILKKYSYNIVNNGTIEGVEIDDSTEDDGSDDNTEDEGSEDSTDDVSETFEVDINSVTFGPTSDVFQNIYSYGTSVSVKVTSSSGWNFQSYPDWVTITLATSAGFTFTVDEDYEGTGTGSIILESTNGNTISVDIVLTDDVSETFEVDINSVTFGTTSDVSQNIYSYGTSVSVKVTSSSGWNFQSYPDWITITLATSAGFTFSVDEDYKGTGTGSIILESTNGNTISVDVELTDDSSNDSSEDDSGDSDENGATIMTDITQAVFRSTSSSDNYYEFGTEVRVTVTSDVNWSIKSNSTWISITYYNEGDDFFIFTVYEDADFTTSSGQIVLETEDGTIYTVVVAVMPT